MWAATGEAWKDCQTEKDSSPYLILAHPDKYPDKIKPSLAELRLDKFLSDLKRGCAKGFIPDKDLQEWIVFLDQLQDEEGKKVI